MVTRPESQQDDLVFDVVAGRVYQLSIVLAHASDLGQDITRSTMVAVFCDQHGQRIDPRLTQSPAVVPHADTLTIETVPATSDEALNAAALCTRYFLIPPDAVTLTLTDIATDVVIVRADLDPLNVIWSGEQGQQAVRIQAEIAQRRAKILGTAWPQMQIADLLGMPQQQLRAITAYFRAGGQWGSLVHSLDVDDLRRATDLRLMRQRAQADVAPIVGFIGSARGHERLTGLCNVVRLRPLWCADQIKHLGLSVIIIETNLNDDWADGFAQLDGALPSAGAQVFDHAEAADVPVHLWMTTATDTALLWRDCAARATRVIVEGDPADWADVPYDAIVPRAVEPVACSLAAPDFRPRDLMLVVAAADVFQSSQLVSLLRKKHVYNTLVTDFQYAFRQPDLRARLGRQGTTIHGARSRSAQRALLQTATIVVLPANTLRTDVDLAQMAMDAIASGAIPVMWGTPRSDDALLTQLDRAYAVSDLVSLQGLYRVGWYRERRWRDLHDYVVRHHVWTGAHRAAVLGADPMSADFDRPRMSVVLITRRPQMIDKCLATFRAQDWPNKELILVFNTDDVPEDMPVLEANEHIFAQPPSAAIGACLNHAIAQATGRYWCKMDDDDYYSDTYLRQTAAYYRSTQADVVGRQATYYYFAGDDAVMSRTANDKRNFAMMNAKGHISGATLSGRKGVQVPRFSDTERNSADRQWVERVIHQDHRVFSAGGTEMIVHRDAKETNHTWQILGDAKFMDGFAPRIQGNITRLLRHNRPKDDA